MEVGGADGVGGLRRWFLHVVLMVFLYKYTHTPCTITTNQVHPEMAISKRCVSVINSMVGDVFGRLAGEAKNLCAKADKKTLDSRDVQTATRLVLPGELAKHAVSEGTRAVVKFTGHAFK